jgi:hypothetical protein
MTNQQHPITPPPELVEQWAKEKTLLGAHPPLHVYMTTRAARWGADQELEACATLMPTDSMEKYLRTARRPKPPSLKEQALLALNKLPPNRDCGVAHETIRRALEALPND